jgi:hypothetical protein
MRRRINLATLYDKAITQLKGIEYDGAPPRGWPDVCPFTLDGLLNEEPIALEKQLRDSASDSLKS